MPVRSPVEQAVPSPDGAPPRSRTAGPPARLVASQLRRLRRIVDAAVELAEKGGFEAVRPRDVADLSGVALGTLYKYFRSKEDLLLYALYERIEQLEATSLQHEPAGATDLERVTIFFRLATAGFTREPHFARAVVRAMAGGDPDMAVKIAGTQLRLIRLIVAALRKARPELEPPLDASVDYTRERSIGLALLNVWFASLVGWSAGLHPTETVIEHVQAAARLMLEGGAPR